jgi:hypothetical protein
MKTIYALALAGLLSLAPVSGSMAQGGGGGGGGSSGGSSGGGGGGGGGGGNGK